MDPLSRARAVAASITKRIRTAPDFDAILPINDYTQDVRSTIMRGATIARIEAATNTSITQKGRFCGAGEKTSLGEKLHLLVEGHTFGDVETAMRKLGELLPGGGMAVSGGGKKKILLERSGGPTFRLVLPGFRCLKCELEFWTVEDARSHFERDNAAEL